MQTPFTTGSSFLIFRLFIALFLSIFGFSLVFKGIGQSEQMLGSVLAAAGLTFLIVMWLILRGSEAR